MSTGYRLAYHFGLTPWEQAGVGFGPQLASLLDREETGRAEPYGTALDVGCGSGDHAIELARRGWEVTGVDAVAKALQDARAKASSSGSRVRFLEGDATRLEDSVGRGYRLLLDVGCFHGFKPAERRGYARGATAVTDPGRHAAHVRLRARPPRSPATRRGPGGAPRDLPRVGAHR